MAKYSIPNQDDETQAQAVQPSGPVDPSAATPAPAQKARPSRFLDIQRLLNANAGQGQRIAQSAIGAANTYAGQAQQQLNSAKDAYGQQVAAGTPKAFTPPSTPLTQGTQIGSTASPARTGSPWAGLTPASAAGTSTLPVGRATTTLNVPVNDARTTAAANQAAQATYTGPHSLADTKGVDVSSIQGAYQRADDAYKALGQSPATLLGRTGGVGLLDDALAQHEAGGQLKAASQRFPGLRAQLDQAIGNTAPADSAAMTAEGTANAAKSYLGQQAADENQASVNQQEADNAAFQSQQDDESAYQHFLADGNGRMAALTRLGARMNGFNNTIDGMSPKDWFFAHRDALRGYGF
jgi:hypothetical protein